jgi:Mn-dependent DtxR family transcriptional regulator
MEKESDILKIVKEDILRILAESGGEVKAESIEDEVRASHIFVCKAIGHLKKEKLILEGNGTFWLTSRGKTEARDILEKHLLLEKYFEDIKSKKEAHNISHIIEHHVSKEVIDNLKKLSTFKGSGLPLIEFKKGKGFITDMILDTQLFERIISMGIFPGENIEILGELPNGVILKIRNKKIFLAREIAKNIKFLTHEKA